MTANDYDWKLTAYALGELDEPDCAEVARHVAESPELQREVAAIRETAGVLRDELGAVASAGLPPLNLAPAPASAGRLRSTVPRRRIWLPTAIAASIALCAVGVWMSLPELSRTRELASSVASRTGSPVSGYETEPSSMFRGASDSRQPDGALTPARRGRGVDPEPLLSQEDLDTLASLAYIGVSSEPHSPNPLDGWYMSVSSEHGSEPHAEFYAGGMETSRGSAAPGEPHDDFTRYRGISFGYQVSFDPGDRRERMGVDNRTLLGYDKGPFASETSHGERYAPIVDNPFTPVAAQPLSTFSIDVDTASYANIRRFISHGTLPPPDAVRIEEMINYFDYAYPPPTGEHPFSVSVEIADCPWAGDHRLARIGIRGYELAPHERPSANLVFLVDVSGSMQAANKLPLVREALNMLVDQLRDDDSIGIVTYAGTSGVALEPTIGSNKMAVRDAVSGLRPGGSTNGAAGIETAYEMAADYFIEGGVNRVILATDGDFNVGVTGQGDLQRLIEEKAGSGVFLSVLGFGMGNLQDATLETLADRGNGNYAYIDTLEEARKVLVDQIGGTLVTIAKDVKIQVEFNPVEVAAYRLIGYENRLLASQDFNNDTKDAGEIGAGHTVTALYEIVPAGVALDAASVDPLKYQTPTDASPLAHTGEMMTVKLRYKMPDGDASTLVEVPVIDDGRTFAESSDDFAFAAAVAAFGTVLRGSASAERLDYATIIELAEGAMGEDAFGYRAEFIELVAAASRVDARHHE